MAWSEENPRIKASPRSSIDEILIFEGDSKVIWAKEIVER